MDRRNDVKIANREVRGIIVVRGTSIKEKVHGIDKCYSMTVESVVTLLCGGST